MLSFLLKPERIDPGRARGYDVRSDVWSLGITLVCWWFFVFLVMIFKINFYYKAKLFLFYYLFFSKVCFKKNIWKTFVLVQEKEHYIKLGSSRFQSYWNKFCEKWKSNTFHHRQKQISMVFHWYKRTFFYKNLINIWMTSRIFTDVS